VVGRSLVVANYTHAPYRQSFAQAAQLLKLSAVLVRGTEGDPIAWEGDAHPLLAWLDGQPAELPIQMGDPARERVEYPPAGDIEATARFCERVLTGVSPMPAAIARQQACLLHLALQAMTR
jgi:anthranilate phosphoribosyltransferase